MDNKGMKKLLGVLSEKFCFVKLNIGMCFAFLRTENETEHYAALAATVKSTS